MSKSTAVVFLLIGFLVGWCAGTGYEVVARPVCTEVK